MLVELMNEVGLELAKLVRVRAFEASFDAKISAHVLVPKEEGFALFPTRPRPFCIYALLLPLFRYIKPVSAPFSPSKLILLLRTSFPVLFTLCSVSLLFPPFFSIMTTNPYTIGTTFPTIQDARKAILRYTVEQSLSYRIVKSDMTRYSLACRAESCTFHLYCNYSRKKKLVIVSVYKPHTCPPETHENWKMARSMQYVVPRLARSFHANRSLKPSEIQESELLNGHRLKYHQAWRARKQLETFLQNHDFEDSVLPDPEEPRKKRVLVGYGSMFTRFFPILYPFII